jgi:hypothetical protein
MSTDIPTLPAPNPPASPRPGDLEPAQPTQTAEPPYTQSAPNRATAPHNSVLQLPEPDPWPSPVEPSLLLSDIVRLLLRFVVLPACAAEIRSFEEHFAPRRKGRESQDDGRIGEAERTQAEARFLRRPRARIGHAEAGD